MTAFWTGLGWATYILAFVVLFVGGDVASATFAMAMGCFFLLVAVRVGQITAERP
jgi:hypothetical protein